MGAPERFNLRPWDGFEANTRVALVELREEVEFFDVTLVSDDGKQVKANKIILAGGSSFFHKILWENPHPHPLIYLKEVKYKYLLSMLNFLYTGEANIAEEDLKQFLDIAEDLKIMGLTPFDKQIKSLPKTDTPRQSQMFAEEIVPLKRKAAPQSQVAAQENAPVKSKTDLPNAIPAPQGEVAAQEQSPAESLSSSHSIKPALYQGQVSADESTSLSRESLRRCVSPRSSIMFPNSNCEDDACKVKVEVVNASKDDTCNVKEFYGMDDKGKQYTTCFSKRNLHNEKNSHYLRKQNEDMEQDQNDESISTVKLKEELIDSNNDTFHAKAVDSVVGNEDGFRAWCEQDKNKNCDKDKIVDSKCDIAVTQEANIHEQPTHNWYEQVKDIKEDNKTQEVEQDLDDEEFYLAERNFQCSFCNKKFAAATTLKVHKRIHAGEKPFQCLVCTKRFSQLGNLNSHKRIHTGEKPFQCLHCSKRFISPSHLNYHSKSHTDEKPHKCMVCSKQFSQRNELTKHERIHTGEKPYQCLVCPKRFSQLGNLNSHKMIHTGEKPYQCKQCSKGFITSSHLNWHNKSQHQKK